MRSRVHRAAEIGARVQQARFAKRLDAKDLASKSGLAQRTLDHVESGATLAKGSTLRKLAPVLGVSFDWLETGEGQGPVVITPRAVVEQHVNKMLDHAASKRPSRAVLVYDIQVLSELMQTIDLEPSHKESFVRCALVPLQETIEGSAALQEYWEIVSAKRVAAYRD